MDKAVDAKLVNEFQSGNKAALTQLVKRWHKPFCNKAYWIVNDADLAKDIAQECWTTIIAKIHSLKDTHSFGGWALRIVYSKSLDVLRHNARKRIQLHRFAEQQELYEEDVEDSTALKTALLKSIKMLPQRQQEVIKLFYVEDYSLKEISDLLKISVGTAKSRLFHAREKLKQTIKFRNYEK